MSITSTLFLIFLPALTLQISLKPYDLTATNMFIDVDIDLSSFIDQNEVDYSFRQYDTNSNGRVSRTEYIQHLNQHIPSMAPIAHALYDIYDVDNDDQLDRHDYDFFFRLLDGDVDGLVSHFEYVRYWSILFTDLEHLHTRK
ncbi:unnamed protein product [Lymnaea stagnalis]|uniref:EF-hand domain-containing protein n=1 Tax=Lymnaea stagnalis TaxID=6523 RepID=A0AAV2IEW6_LYMST